MVNLVRGTTDVKQARPAEKMAQAREAAALSALRCALALGG
jgi:hypothetical protein